MDMNSFWSGLRPTIKAFKDDWPLFILILLSLAVLLIHIYEDYDGGIRSSDIHVYWQYARNFIAGNGFIRNTLATGEAWASGLTAKPVSIFIHPLLISLFYHLSGRWIEAATLSTCFLYLLTVPLIYFFADAVFDRKVAILSSLFFIFNRNSLLFSLYGGSDPLFTFLLLLGLFTLLKTEKSYNFLIVGILIGMANATRQVGLLYILPILIYIWFKKPDKGLARLLFFLVGLTIFSKLAWAINAFYYGNASLYKVPSGGYSSGPLLCHSSAYPGYTATKIFGFPSSPLKMILTDPFIRNAFFKKCTANLYGVIKHIVPDLAANLYLGLFFLGGLFLKLKDKMYTRFRWLLVFFLLVQILIGVVFLYAERYLYPLIPYVIIWGTAFLIYGIEKLTKKKKPLKYISYAICIALIIFPLRIGHTIDKTGWLTAKERRGRSVGVYEKFGKFLQERIGPEIPVVADGPWIVDVYGGGRRMVMINPRTLRMMDLLHKNKMDLDAIVLTSAYCARNDFQEWKYLYFHPQPFNGFTPYVFEQGSFRAVLYVRDSKKESKRFSDAGFKAVDNGCDEEGLLLLAKAFQIDPRNQDAISKSMEVRKRMKEKGREHYFRAKELFAVNMDLAAYHKLSKAFACSYQEQGSRAMYENLTQKLVKQRILERVKFTNTANFKIKITLSGFPYNNSLTDGINLCKEHIYVGGDLDVCFDLGRARHVNAIVAKAYLSQKNSLTHLKVFSSIDGYNYTLEKELTNISIKAEGYHILTLDNLNIFSRFIKLSARGDQIKIQSLPLRFDEVELWGYVESGDEVMVSIDSFQKKEMARFELEVENYHRRVGKKVDDFYASGNRAVYAAADEFGDGFLVCGTYQVLPSGNYEASFRLRVDRNDFEKKVALIDISTNHGRKTLVSETIFGNDFSVAGGEYQNFTLSFSLLQQTEIEFRVRFAGTADLWADKISIKGELFEYYYNDVKKNEIKRHYQPDFQDSVHLPNI